MVVVPDWIMFVICIAVMLAAANFAYQKKNPVVATWVFFLFLQVIFYGLLTFDEPDASFDVDMNMRLTLFRQY